MPPEWLDILALVFPHHCHACRAVTDQWLCAECQADLDRLAAEARCALCGLPVPEEGAPCPWCRGRERRIVRRIARLGVHAPPLQGLIHQMKYRGRWGVAQSLGEQLARHRSVQALLAGAQVIVPVPLHWRRQLARGYNQSELLAGELLKSPVISASARILPALARLRHTRQQSLSHSIPERLRNVQGAFGLRPRFAAQIAGRNVVLVDDVYTTGATLRAAGWALRAAKPARVDAVVLAVADPKNRDFTAISEPTPAQHARRSAKAQLSAGMPA